MDAMGIVLRLPQPAQVIAISGGGIRTSNSYSSPPRCHVRQERIVFYHGVLVEVGET